MGSCTADEGFVPAMEDLHPLLHTGGYPPLCSIDTRLSNGWLNCIRLLRESEKTAINSLVSLHWGVCFWTETDGSAGYLLYN